VKPAPAPLRPKVAVLEPGQWLKLDFAQERVAVPLPPPKVAGVKEAIIRWLEEKL
jgi:hypothetical protein